MNIFEIEIQIEGKIGQQCIQHFAWMSTAHQRHCTIAKLTTLSCNLFSR